MKIIINSYRDIHYYNEYFGTNHTVGFEIEDSEVLEIIKDPKVSYELMQSLMILLFDHMETHHGMEFPTVLDMFGLKKQRHVIPVIHTLRKGMLVDDDKQRVEQEEIFYKRMYDLPTVISKDPVRIYTYYNLYHYNRAFNFTPKLEIYGCVSIDEIYDVLLHSHLTNDEANVLFNGLLHYDVPQKYIRKIFKARKHQVNALKSFTPILHSPEIEQRYKNIHYRADRIELLLKDMEDGRM